MGQGQGQEQEEIRAADPDPGSGAFVTPGSGAFVTPGSGMGKKSRSRSERLEKVLVINTQILLCGCGPDFFSPWIWDPGWKNSDPG